MKEQLLLSWQTHNAKNLLLLRTIPEAFLSQSLSAKGRTIGEQIAHIHNIRISWTDHVAKSLFQKALVIQKETSLSTPLLQEALTASAGIIEQVINNRWEKEGRLPLFKAGLIPFVSYLVSHESHHRGNIVLTLKQSGFSLPNELKWGLWDWQ